MRWAPDLYRWNPARHRSVRVISAPWYEAFTSDYGYYKWQFGSSWRYPNGGNTFAFIPYRINLAGRYRVKHYLFWAQGGRESSGYGINTVRWSRTCTYR